MATATINKLAHRYVQLNTINKPDPINHNIVVVIEPPEDPKRHVGSACIGTYRSLFMATLVRYWRPKLSMSTVVSPFP